MSDFSHLKKLAPDKGRTAEYSFSEIEGSPTLVVKVAGEVNVAYWRALLNDQLSRPRSAGRRSAQAVDKAMKGGRDTDRRLYAKHVVVDWRGVFNSNGDVVPFSADECAAFLEALPDFLFDTLRAFCTEPGNFQDLVDGEEAAKT